MRKIDVVSKEDRKTTKSKYVINVKFMLQFYEDKNKFDAIFINNIKTFHSVLSCFVILEKYNRTLLQFVNNKNTTYFYIYIYI